MTKTYKTVEVLGNNVVERLAFFLLEETGSVCGTWEGRMTADDQRRLFGRFFGKGRLEILGNGEVVHYTIKVCFGMDWDTQVYRWTDLDQRPTVQL